MQYQQTTQVPNELFDKILPNISFSELKILLVIIRQTFGWKTKNGERKKRDRISHEQFKQKTGLSRRIISETIQSLILKQNITVTARDGSLLHDSKARKGKPWIYYAPLFHTCAIESKKVGKSKHEPMHYRVYNKTNVPKINNTNGFPEKQTDSQRISEILKLKRFGNQGFC
jgi:hypothetical protein